MTLQFRPNATLDEMFEEFATHFEAQGHDVHRHAILNPLEGIGKIFSYFEDDRAMTYMVYDGQWSPSDAAQISQLIASLEQDDNPFAQPVVHLISKHVNVPSELRKYVVGEP